MYCSHHIVSFLLEYVYLQFNLRKQKARAVLRILPSIL